MKVHAEHANGGILFSSLTDGNLPGGAGRRLQILKGDEAWGFTFGQLLALGEGNFELEPTSPISPKGGGRRKWVFSRPEESRNGNAPPAPPAAAETIGRAAPRPGRDPAPRAGAKVQPLGTKAPAIAEEKVGRRRPKRLSGSSRAAKASSRSKLSPRPPEGSDVHGNGAGGRPRGGAGLAYVLREVLQDFDRNGAAVRVLLERGPSGVLLRSVATSTANGAGAVLIASKEEIHALVVDELERRGERLVALDSATK